jgi:hypothetical protein
MALPSKVEDWSGCGDGREYHPHRQADKSRRITPGHFRRTFGAAFCPFTLAQDGHK